MSEPARIPALPADWRERVTHATGAPAFLLPWLDRFYDEADAALVLGAASRSDTQAIERAWRHGALDRDENGRYSPASFRVRLEHWALFEGWLDLPDNVRRQVCAWDGESYVDGLRDRIERLKAGGMLQDGERGAGYLLLDEAEQVLRRAAHVYLWPCNCRAYVGGCSKPSLVCLRFENDRGIGWEISTERAIEILREANRRGLMQVGEMPPGDEPITAGAICNCCADCCFEHLASRELDAARVWPRSRYVAATPAACSGCGRCVRRCPFGAIDQAAARQTPTMRTEECRGCGVCSTGCPETAIVMQPVGG